MEYDFYAEDGSKLTVGPIPSEGLDSGDKATNKALSAAFKYMCIQTFWVPTEDIEDGDKDSPEIGKPKDQPKTKAEPSKPQGKPDKTENYQDNQHSAALITDSQRKRLFAIANKYGWNETMIKTQIQDLYGIDSTKKLNRFNYDDLISKIEFSKK